MKCIPIYFVATSLYIYLVAVITIYHHRRQVEMCISPIQRLLLVSSSKTYLGFFRYLFNWILKLVRKSWLLNNSGTICLGFLKCLLCAGGAISSESQKAWVSLPYHRKSLAKVNDDLEIWAKLFTCSLFRIKMILNVDHRCYIVSLNTLCGFFCLYPSTIFLFLLPCAFDAIIKVCFCKSSYFMDSQSVAKVNNYCTIVTFIHLKD